MEADETLLGGYTKKHRGRSLEQKEAVQITAEQLADVRTGNLRMGHTENFQADTLKFALKGTSKRLFYIA